LPMERISIQSDMKYMGEVERFIDTVCDQMNIHNYAATISVSLMAAVKNAIAVAPVDDNVNKIEVCCDHCRGGIRFSVSGEGHPFATVDASKPVSLEDNSLPSEREANLFLMESLSDRIKTLDDGRTIEMVYLINGIRTSRAMERQMTLQNYFAPKLVHA